MRLDAYVIGYYDVCAEKVFGKNDTDDVITKIEIVKNKNKIKNGSWKSQKIEIVFFIQKIYKSTLRRAYRGKNAYEGGL